MFIVLIITSVSNFSIFLFVQCPQWAPDLPGLAWLPKGAESSGAEREVGKNTYKSLCGFFLWLRFNYWWGYVLFQEIHVWEKPYWRTCEVLLEASVWWSELKNNHFHTNPVSGKAGKISHIKLNLNQLFKMRLSIHIFWQREMCI